MCLMRWRQGARGPCHRSMAEDHRGRQSLGERVYIAPPCNGTGVVAKIIAVTTGGCHEAMSRR